jgi:hypothetical protein
MLDRLSAVVFLLTCAFCVAQQPQPQPAETPHLSVRTAPQFLVRISLADITTAGSSRTCVIVFTDQSFHMEKSQKLPGAQEKATFVSEGMLTRDEQIQVASIIGDPELEKLDVATVAHKPFGYKKVFHEVFASIPRSSAKVQYLAAASADTEGFEPAAKTLLTLVNTIDARKPPEVKNARHDDCHEPSPARPLVK